MRDVTAFWYAKRMSAISFFLLPFATMFLFLSSIRRWFYQWGVFNIHYLPVPVIVIGNITVGGTGKSPLVSWLAIELSRLGYRPGIISRGYRGRQKTPLRVTPDSDVAECGDEAVMLAGQTHCPVVVGVDRVAAAGELLSGTDCDVILSDDGLQHFRLGRDIEIAVVDGKRQFGNQLQLPAGPLREPLSRLKSVDFVVVNGGDSSSPCVMNLVPDQIVSLSNGKRYSVSLFHAKKIHAVAGIGNPRRFFDTLKQAGFDIIEHAFPDHHHFVGSDLVFKEQLPIVMTEKDAVKCVRLIQDDAWYLTVKVEVTGGLMNKILRRLKYWEAENEESATSDINGNNACGSDCHGGHG